MGLRVIGLVLLVLAASRAAPDAVDDYVRDKVNAYLPDPPDAWRDVTIYHLLTHTAGLAPLGDDFKSMVWTATVKTPALYAAAKADPMGSAPGEKWRYSDVGYFLLGMVIEK